MSVLSVTSMLYCPAGRSVTGLPSSSTRDISKALGDCWVPTVPRKVGAPATGLSEVFCGAGLLQAAARRSTARALAREPVISAPGSFAGCLDLQAGSSYSGSTRDLHVVNARPSADVPAVGAVVAPATSPSGLARADVHR